MNGNHVLPFIYDVNGATDTSVPQEDNCGPHRAKSIDTYLQNEEVKRMNLPAQSPDLNPIDNIWCLMKRHFRKRLVHLSIPMPYFLFYMKYGMQSLMTI